MPDLPALQYAHVASRLFGQPLLATPDMIEHVMHTIGARLGVSAFDGQPLMARAEEDKPFKRLTAHPDSDYADENKTGYDRVGDVAFITLEGLIVRKYSGWNALCGMTSTEALLAAYTAAHADPGVRAVYLAIDSGGGEGSGMADAVDRMMAIKRQSGKRVYAHANDIAASAAFWFGSVADVFTASQDSMVGSVGVYILHRENSRALDEKGVTVTMIRRGQQKASTNPHEPLSADGRALLQAVVDESFENFVASVVANRPALTREAVEGTESRLLRAAEAPGLGFIDAVMSEEQAVLQALARTG